MQIKDYAVFIVLGVLNSLASPDNPVNAQDQMAPEPMQQANVPPMEHDCGTHLYSILVTIQDVRHSDGTIIADLHGDDPDNFLGKGQNLKHFRFILTHSRQQRRGSCSARD